MAISENANVISSQCALDERFGFIENFFLGLRWLEDLVEIVCFEAVSRTHEFQALEFDFALIFGLRLERDDAIVNINFRLDSTKHTHITLQLHNPLVLHVCVSLVKLQLLLH